MASTLFENVLMKLTSTNCSKQFIFKKHFGVGIRNQTEKKNAGLDILGKYCNLALLELIVE